MDRKSTKIDADQYEALDKLAKENYRPLAMELRLAIRQHLQKHIPRKGTR